MKIQVCKYKVLGSSIWWDGVASVDHLNGNIKFVISTTGVRVGLLEDCVLIEGPLTYIDTEVQL